MGVVRKISCRILILEKYSRLLLVKIYWRKSFWICFYVLRFLPTMWNRNINTKLSKMREIKFNRS